MAEDGRQDRERLPRIISRLHEHFKAGHITPLEFCANVFHNIIFCMLWMSADEHTLISCIERMPRAVLKLLSDYADAGYKPRKYVAWTSNGNGRYLLSDIERQKREVASILRHLHGAIEEQLRRYGNPTEGEMEYALPQRLPGDPPMGVPGVDPSEEPYTVDDLVARMGRFLGETDAQTREKFESIRIAPVLMDLYDQRNMEQAWVVGREGPQALCYDHMAGRLEIGWILSTRKVYVVCGEDSLAKILAHWPVGAIKESDTIDIADVAVRDGKFNLIMAAYGQLENTDAVRALLRRKVDFYLEQIDFSEKTRVRCPHPKIVLACDTAPVPELGEFLTEIRRYVEGRQTLFEVVTGVFESSDQLPGLRSIRDFVPV